VAPGQLSGHALVVDLLREVSKRFQSLFDAVHQCGTCADNPPDDWHPGESRFENGEGELALLLSIVTCWNQSELPAGIQQLHMALKVVLCHAWRGWRRSGLRLFKTGKGFPAHLAEPQVGSGIAELDTSHLGDKALKIRTAPHSVSNRLHAVVGGGGYGMSGDYSLTRPKRGEAPDSGRGWTCVKPDPIISGMNTGTAPSVRRAADI